MKSQTLTHKEKLFARKYVANNGNGTQTALQVYNTKDPKTAGAIASENLAKPKVQNEIEEILRAQGLSSDIIAAEFKPLALAQVDKVSADVKLRSLIELSKILRLYPSQKHSNLNVSLRGNLKDLSFNQVKDQLKVIDSELGTILDDDTNPIVDEEE